MYIAKGINSGETLNDHLFDGLRWFTKQTALPSSHCTLVYGGEETQTRAVGRVLPWKRAHTLTPAH